MGCLQDLGDGGSGCWVQELVGSLRALAGLGP